MGINNKAEFEEAAIQLYELEKQSRENDKLQKLLRGYLFTYMKNNKMVPYSTDTFILELSAKNEYGVPTATRLRQILGKDAEQYISEVVSPEIRLRLPPALSAQECPVIKQSEFVRLKLL
jgi:hypothetical protein